MNLSINFAKEALAKAKKFVAKLPEIYGKMAKNESALA